MESDALNDLIKTHFGPSVVVIAADDREVTFEVSGKFLAVRELEEGAGSSRSPGYELYVVSSGRTRAVWIAVTADGRSYRLDDLDQMQAFIVAVPQLTPTEIASMVAVNLAASEPQRVIANEGELHSFLDEQAMSVPQDIWEPRRENFAGGAWAITFAALNVGPRSDGFMGVSASAWRVDCDADGSLSYKVEPLLEDVLLNRYAP